MQPDLVQQAMIKSTSLRGVFAVVSSSWSNSNSSSNNGGGSPVSEWRKL